MLKEDLSREQLEVFSLEHNQPNLSLLKIVPVIKELHQLIVEILQEVCYLEVTQHLMLNQV